MSGTHVLFEFVVLVPLVVLLHFIEGCPWGSPDGLNSHAHTESRPAVKMFSFNLYQLAGHGRILRSHRCAGRTFDRR
jgi:hypothetical protein